MVLPFVRVASTDLNMTLTIAIISVVMTQYIGFKALGIGYLTKFFNFGTLFKSPLGGIDVAVGLLELIGDFAKILSFSFRLSGRDVRRRDLAVCDELPGADFALALLHPGVSSSALFRRSYSPS